MRFQQYKIYDVIFPGGHKFCSVAETYDMFLNGNAEYAVPCGVPEKKVTRKQFEKYQNSYNMFEELLEGEL